MKIDSDVKESNSHTAGESQESGSSSRRPKKKKRRRVAYPFLFRLLHWTLGASTIVLLLTGMSLHAVARPGWSLLSSRLPAFFWPGRINIWHFSAATVFMASLVAVVWIYSRRKVKRRVTHLTLLGGGLVMMATAQVMLNPFGPAIVYSSARLIHAVVGLGVLLVAFVWHTVDGFGRFRRALIPAFHPWLQPRFVPVACYVPVFLASMCLVLSGMPTVPSWRELKIKRISPVEGALAELPWNEAAPLAIELANGIGFRQGRTNVTLRGLHDGENLFVMAEWADPVEDRRYMPWLKTADGWQWMMTDQEDESLYYEDKFGLVFPTVPDWQFDRVGCAIYCHAGGGRPYGYKASENHIADVWHWKSSRTDPVGQADDKYWSATDFEAKDVGRHGDPKEGGGYVKNVSEDKTHPAFLPESLSDIGQGVIPKEKAIEYSPEAADVIPTGTIVPGLVLSPFEGDRGDVRCESKYENGRWQIILGRKLDTGSEFDARFVPGQKQSFGCAAFDHSSKRHAYGLAAYRMVLEP